MNDMNALIAAADALAEAGKALRTWDGRPTADAKSEWDEAEEKYRAVRDVAPSNQKGNHDMKIIVTNSYYPKEVPNGTIMSVSWHEPYGAVFATIDGGDGFKWFMAKGTYRPYDADDDDSDGLAYQRQNAPLPVVETVTVEFDENGDEITVNADLLKNVRIKLTVYDGIFYDTATVENL